MNTFLQFAPLVMGWKDPLRDSLTASTPLVQRSRRISQQELVLVLPPLQLEGQHYLMVDPD